MKRHRGMHINISSSWSLECFLKDFSILKGAFLCAFNILIRQWLPKLSSLSSTSLFVYAFFKQAWLWNGRAWVCHQFNILFHVLIRKFLLPLPQRHNQGGPLLANKRFFHGLGRVSTNQYTFDYNDLRRKMGIISYGRVCWTYQCEWLSS